MELIRKVVKMRMDLAMVVSKTWELVAVQVVE